MRIEIREESHRALAEYGEVPISFQRRVVAESGVAYCSLLPHPATKRIMKRMKSDMAGRIAADLRIPSPPSSEGRVREEEGEGGVEERRKAANSDRVH